MTAARVGQLLVGVVQNGTGSAAGVDGFSVAGKTGTAQKAEPGGYSATDYAATFAGFAPARDPLFTGVVILDVQKPNHSGANAARVFGRIADRVLWRYRKTGWGTERLVSSGRGIRQLGRDRAGRVAPASWRDETPDGTPPDRSPAARDLVARRLRRADAAGPETTPGTTPGTTQSTLIAGTAAPAAGRLRTVADDVQSPAPTAGSLIPASLPDVATESQGGPEDPAAGADPPAAVESPPKPSAGNRRSHPE